MRHFALTVLAAVFSACTIMAQNYTLSTPNTTLIVANDNGTPKFVYYGPKINPATSVESMRAAGMTFDCHSYPAFGIWSENEKAIAVTQPDGSMTLDLEVESVKETSDADGSIIQINMKDRVYPFVIRQYFKAYNGTDVISTWTELVNNAKKTVALELFASANIPVIRSDNYVTHFHGAWGAESFVEEGKLQNGQLVIANKQGVRNAALDNPSLMLSVGGPATENSGTVFGGVLAWSGNYKIKVHAQNNSLEIFAGINEETSRYMLDGGKTFTTPEFAMTYSTEGKGGVSRAIHRWARKYALWNGDRERMVLLNSWEGVYMNITQDVMDQMMGDIAALGGELFVMDDGWFGDKYPRNNGETSLGDWTVCREKLPQGIEGLTESARKHGVKFGIWIEPEMTNTRSELYEKHPDWVIQQPYRENRKGRGGTQQVLDLSNPAVQEFVFSVVDRLMTAHPDIAYIKWDDNMTLYNYGSTFLPADRQSHLYIEYHRGMDKVLRRIQEKYPRLVMQSCASGGGRVNYGVLPYYDEFWTSDNTDALQRIYMQWGVSNFYPAVAMASHVSASPNHQTGRNVPLKLRFDVAMSGRLGLELQPSKMTGKEKEFARRAIADYKEIRPIVQQGDLYRLISPYDKTGYASLMYVAPEKDRAVWFVYKLEHFLNMPSPAFRMAGLDPGKRYRITELNVDGKPVPQDGKTFSGAFLMENGLEFTVGKEYASRVLELKAVE